MKEKILITGAPGWLGNRLVEILCKNKKSVRCIVLKNMDLSFLKSLPVELVEGDITDRSSLDVAFKDISTVVHVAGVIHVKKIDDFYKINTKGTENMIGAAVKAKVKKFVYVSSNSAQGYCSRNASMVESAPCKPYATYGQSKLLAENAVNKAHIEHGLNTTIFRPCWFYGPGQPERQTNLMKMVLRGKAPVFGDGLNRRSMTYIDNLAEAVLLAIKNSKISDGQTYWIADEKPYTTLEIYQTIADLLQVPLKIKKYPAVISKATGIADLMLQKLKVYNIFLHVAGEMTQDIACDISKAKRDLGYNPKIEIKEGMRRSVEWCKLNGLL